MPKIEKAKTKLIILNVLFILSCAVSILAYRYLTNVNLSAPSLKPKPAYYLMSSSMLNKGAQLSLISRTNDLISKERLNLQDISKVALTSGRILFAGERANNLLEITEKGQKQFHLLDNPAYSGVTAICYGKDQLISVMNGNMTKEGYQSLLVVQDLAGNLLFQKVIPLFAQKAVVNGGKAYIVGAAVKNDGNFACALTVVDLQAKTSATYETEAEHKYKDVIACTGKLYCLSGDRNAIHKEIHIYDSETLQLNEKIYLPEEADTLFEFNEKLHLLIGNKIQPLSAAGKLEKELYTLQPNGRFVQAHKQGEHLYILYKQSEAGSESRTIKVQIVDLHLRYGSKVVTDYTLDNQPGQLLAFAPLPLPTR